MKRLTAIYWVKDEARYIPEWIEFHLMQGFEHFILYDNNSTDGSHEILRPYIDADILELRSYPAEMKQRCLNRPLGAKNYWVAETCMLEQRKKSDWIHFHAVDEFTYCPDGTDLKDFLTEFDQYGGLSVCWQCYNSNGHIKRPEGLVIENYTVRVPDPMCHVKTFLKVGRAKQTCGSLHNWEYIGNYQSVNENHKPVVGSFCPDDFSFKRIRNHHYVTMSREEFDIKTNKGILDSAWAENRRRHNYDYQFDDYNNREHIFDDILKPWFPKVREAILKRYQSNKEFLPLINH
jgi:hypothetical protein